MPRERQRARRGGHSGHNVLPDLPVPPPPHHPGPDFDGLGFIPIEANNREFRAIDAMQWFKDVIYHISGARPLVVRHNTGLYSGSYVVSIAVQERALRDPNPGDTVIFHVQSGAYEQEYVASRHAVRKALEQLESHIGHVIPDYSFFKMKALELNEPDVTQVPKMISPPYESEYDTLNCGYLHTEYGLGEVLRQILPTLGYSFVRPYSSRANGGFQSSVTLMSSQGQLKIYGEALDASYKAKDSALIYALDYVDRYLGIDILDINYSVYGC